MGGHYGSIQVRTTDRAAVKAAAEVVATAMKIRCLIGPELGGWVGVYPEGNGQDDNFGQKMADRLEADVLHLMVHDDDLLAYWLWRKHELVDSYWSKPGILGDENLAEEEKRCGDAEQFRVIVGDNVERLAKVLDRADEYTFEGERLGKLAKVLGMSNAVTEYDYLVSGERGGIKGWRKFERIPPEPEAKKVKGPSAKSLRGKLQKLGILTYFDQQDEFFVTGVGCLSGESFILGWSDHRHANNKLWRLSAPWSLPRVQPFEAPIYVPSIASDPLSDFLLIASGESALVMDAAAEEWTQLSEIAAPHDIRGAAISRSANLVACGAGQYVVIMELSSGKQLCKFGRRNPTRMAIHPSGKWIVVSDDTLGIIRMDSEPTISSVFVGKNIPITIGNVRGIEEPGCVGFSRDGRYLWCGTNVGLRVFEWEPLVGAPRKRAGFHLKIQIPLPSFWSKQVTFIAEEVDSCGIVFGTYRGKLLRLNLETGEYYKLADLPTGGEVKSILFSSDGTALAVYSDYETQKGPRSMPKHTRTWEILDYHKIRNAAQLLGRMEKPSQYLPGSDAQEDLARWRRAKARGT